MQSINKHSKNNRNRRSKKKTLLWVAIAIVLILAAGVAAYTFLYKNKADSNQTNQNKDTTKQGTSTHDSTSQGTTFPVPDDVPEESIKDYSLVTENEQFKIRHDGASDSYLITLYPIVNNPSQQSTYNDQLREYKANALDYLKKQGKDVTKLEIKYEPTEATNL